MSIEARFAAGDWYAVVGDDVSVVLPASQRSRVAALWDLADSGAGVDEILDALLAGGLSSLDHLGLVAHTSGATRVIVRGAATATVSTAAGSEELSATEGTAWAERVLADATGVRLALGAESATADRPLGPGIARVSSVEYGTAAPAESTDVTEPSTEPSAPPAPVVVEESVPAEPEVPPMTPAEPEQVDQPEPEAIEPEAAPEPEPQPEPVEPEPVPVEPQASPEPAVDDAAYDPEVGEADSVAPGMDAPQPYAPVLDSDDAQPDYDVTAGEHSAPMEYGDPAIDVSPTDVSPTDVSPTDEALARAEEDWTDRDGMTQIGQPIPSFDRPPIPGQEMAPPVVSEPVAALVFSTGEVIAVDRAVLVGRAPEARQFASHDQPHVVSVPSPQQQISSTHLEIRPGAGADLGSAIVTDLGSTNGTVLAQPGLDAEDLKPGIAVSLIPGAILDLGDGVTIQVTNP